MTTKAQRLLAIKKLLQNEKISSQEDLLQRLLELGYDFTQATVSRDLKELQAGKKADAEKGSILVLPSQNTSLQDTPPFDHSFLITVIQSIRFVNFFCIIKTLPGYANSIAIVIDKASRYEVAGTIAGDDTILVIPDEGINVKSLKLAFKAIFPGLSDDIIQN